MDKWKDNGEYLTKIGRIHEKSGGKWIISVRKSMNIVTKNVLSRDDGDTTKETAT